MLTKAKKTYAEFPRTFWTLMAASFIDRLGGALIFPFFSLYITEKFGVGMTQVGYLFAIFSISSLLGSFLGGAMTDKFGRKAMILFGLVVSATSSVLMGIVNDLVQFYSIAALVGLLSNAGGPAQQAMIADLLDEEKRTEGYGIWRVVANLAVVIGPAIGGLLAAQSYLLLFITDAITSLITAVIVFVVIPETKPERAKDQPSESFLQTVGGYGRVLRDGLYMAFISVSMLMVIVYMQMNSTLSVYLRDVHGIPPQGFGYILSLNAAMVVAFQFWVTRQISAKPAMLMMAFGTVFFLVGFTMYGFVSSYVLFMLAMVLITIGEMIVTPIAQTLVARFAPEDMRGRYMAMYGFSWIIPSAVGTLFAGLIMDNFDPNWVWYACGIASAITVLGYLMLHIRASQRFADRGNGQPAPATVSPLDS